MGKTASAEREIERFSAEEPASFRSRFAEFDASPWDHQIERDVAAGKLDRFANEALTDLRAGNGRAL